MSKRLKELRQKHSRKKNSYLSNEYAAVQEAIEMGIHLPDVIKKGKGKGGKLLSLPGAESFSSGGTGAPNYYGGSGKGYKTCKHDGSIVVYEKDGKKLFASSWQGLEPASGNWDLIIDLASNVKSGAASFIKPNSSAKFKGLSKHALAANKLPSDLLALDWQDMGIPPVTYDFWIDLWKMLPATTVVACMGGHGRTGTCLVALMIASGMDFQTALTTMRAQHCSKAVESFGQETYLHAMGVTRLERMVAADKLAGIDTTDLEDVLEQEIANAPTFSNSSATKNWGGSKATVPTKAWVVLETEKHMKKLNYQGWDYIKECVQAGCNVYKCEEHKHQNWILPEDSKYDAKGDMLLVV